MPNDFLTPRLLGRSGLTVGRLGLGSSYGAPAGAYEQAFERGCNYFYWGTVRRKGMGNAIRRLASRHRDKIVVVLQSYSRTGLQMLMIRYNAAHRGAEQEVFPYLERQGEPKAGVVCYTGTRWGTLIDPRNTPAGCRTPTAVHRLTARSSRNPLMQREQ